SGPREPRRSDGRARPHEDLAAALAALGVGQRGLDLLDRIDPFHRGGQRSVQDLPAELRIERADLVERARGEAAAEDEADQRLAAPDQRAARHHRVLAGHRAGYKQTIQYGGHPDERGVFTATVRTGEGFGAVFLTNKPIVIAATLKSVVEAGVVALKAFKL